MSSLRTKVLRLAFASLASLALASLIACGGGIEGTGTNKEANGNDPGPSSGGGGGGGTCTAAPSCFSGDTRVANRSACLQDDAKCYERSLCGTTIWCTGGGSQCDGYPVCADGFSEIDSCPSDTNCTTQTTCGVTIHCIQHTQQCAAYPSCDAGHTEISSSSQCLQDDAVCYPRTLCGATIWCTGPSSPDAGLLPPG